MQVFRKLQTFIFIKSKDLYKNNKEFIYLYDKIHFLYRNMNKYACMLLI